MKSKSLDLSKSPSERVENYEYDFVKLYKSAADTVKLSDKHKSNEGINKENFGTKSKSDTPKHERSLYKNKKKNKFEILDLTQINIDGHSLNASARGNSSLTDYKVTSTPKPQNQSPKVKSIMKNSSYHSDNAADSSRQDGLVKRKKRNKSVSFMLEDNDETVKKKTRSDDSILVKKKVESRVKLSGSKKIELEKENKPADVNNVVNIDHVEDKSKKSVYEKKRKIKMDKTKDVSTDMVLDSSNSDNHSQKQKKKVKKLRNQKYDESTEHMETESTNNDESPLPKDKKKKKKRQPKQTQFSNLTEEEEPRSKIRKKEIKPDVIADDLENLSIGDNTFTLTNLLDEMTVADKNKHKKNKKKHKKEKTNSTSSSDAVELGKPVENKEKIKWRKRKWNKDKKGDVDDSQNCVLIENLPLSIMFSYKKLLADHFAKYGIIKKTGIAEVYPMADSKPVFSTTLTFDSEEAVAKALEEDNSLFEGNRIRVKRSLPPTETTLVVRTYAELTEQTLISVFVNAGKIRNIRQLVKGRKSMSTAFIEFDGPESVERAYKLAENATIGGKKLHVSKFEKRKKKNTEKKVKSATESENEGDSENSND